MTKKILSVLVMISIAVMMLNGCDTVNTDNNNANVSLIGKCEAGLIGKWEYSRDTSTTTIEITADDKLIAITKIAGLKEEFKMEHTIKSVKNHKITYENNKGEEYEMEYSDLGSDTVKFGSGESKVEYRKVY